MATDATGSGRATTAGGNPPRLRDAAVVGFGLTLAVLVVGGVLGYTNARRLDDDRRMVGHTHEVIGALESLLSTLKDAETGQRGYLLAGDEKYLEPYEDALKRVPGEFALLAELTSDNPDQQARLAVLEGKIDVRLDELRRTIALMKAGDRPAALKVVRSDTGKAMMDDLRKDIAAMRRAEDDLLERRSDKSAARHRATVLSILLPAVIGIVLVGVVYYLSHRNVRRERRAAFVLAEQKERLRTTLASIGDAVISTDRDGNVTYLNAVAESLTGWANGEAAGLPLTQVFRIVNESTRLPVENPALRALKEGVIVGLANHTVLIARDGTERPIDDSAAPVRCAEGELVGCVLVFRDITERHRQEAELREGERQFRTLAESIPQLAWMANPDGHIFWYNRRWYDYTGTTLEQMEGWGWQSVHDPDELPKVLGRWKGSIATGESFDMVFPLKGSDGVFRPFLTRVEPVKDGDGRVVRWFGTNTDITEQRRAEQELRRRETFIGGVLGSITDAFYAVDRGWRFTFVNDEIVRRFGKPRDEIVGGHIWEMFPDAVSTVAHAQLHRAMADRVAVEYEVYYEPWGRWFLDKAFPTDDGGLAVYTRDITDRRRSAEALLASEHKSRSILESITDGFFTLDRDWRFTYINAAGERFLDRTPGDLTGRVLWDEFPGAVGSEFERAYRRVAAGRVAEAFTAHYPDHDRWYEVNASPAPDGLSVYFRDVSDRKGARGANRPARRRDCDVSGGVLRHGALSHSTDYYFIFDLDGRFVYANRATLELWRLTAGPGRRQDVHGRTRLPGGDGAPDAPQHPAGGRDGGRRCRDETPYTNSFGEAGVTTITSWPPCSVTAEGRGSGRSGRAGTSSERRRAERALRALPRSPLPAAVRVGRPASSSSTPDGRHDHRRQPVHRGDAGLLGAPAEYVRVRNMWTDRGCSQDGRPRRWAACGPPGRRARPLRSVAAETEDGATFPDLRGTFVSNVYGTRTGTGRSRLQCNVRDITIGSGRRTRKRSARRRSFRGRPPQGRVPGDPRPRAAEPAGPAPQRPPDHAAVRGRRKGRAGPHHDGAATDAVGPAGGRPPRREPHHSRQNGTSPGAGRIAVGDRRRSGGRPPADRAGRARTRRRHAGRADLRGRRRDPTGPSRRQPAEQLGQVHPPGRTHLAGGRAGGRYGGGGGEGRRDRHPARHARQGVRDVHPGGPGVGEDDGRAGD